MCVAVYETGVWQIRSMYVKCYIRTCVCDATAVECMYATSVWGLKIFAPIWSFMHSLSLSVFVCFACIYDSVHTAHMHTYTHIVYIAIHTHIIMSVLHVYIHTCNMSVLRISLTHFSSDYFLQNHCNSCNSAVIWCFLLECFTLTLGADLLKSQCCSVFSPCLFCMASVHGGSMTIQCVTLF